jgi:hypothetical protein
VNRVEQSQSTIFRAGVIDSTGARRSDALVPKSNRADYAMPNAALRARVERLLRGDIRLDDLSHIFLDIRTNCPSESVREIGDFIAHNADRNKGIITTTVQDWAITWEFQEWVRQNNLGNAADLSRRPPNYTQALKSSFRQMDDFVIKERTGLTLSAARRALDIITRQFLKNEDGTLKYTGSPTRPEYNLMALLSTVVVSKPAFTDDSLFADFKARLRYLGALRKTEADHLDTLKQTIALFAMSKMHNVELRAPGVNSKLIAKISAPIRDGWMNVGAEGTLPTRLFATSLKSEDCCEADLLAIPQPWACEIELTPGMKLAKLG